MKEKMHIKLVTENDRQLAVVPVGRTQQVECCIWKDDFDLLMSLGLSPSWHATDQGHVRANAYKAPGNNISVARVLLDAKPLECVRYRDSNTYNLKIENLELVQGGFSKKRDRDYITPLGLRKKKKEVSFEVA